jgi:hypothetical protein
VSPEELRRSVGDQGPAAELARLWLACGSGPEKLDRLWLAWCATFGPEHVSQDGVERFAAMPEGEFRTPQALTPEDWACLLASLSPRVREFAIRLRGRMP